MIVRLDHGAAFGLLAKTIEAYGVKALENITTFPMLWRTAMLFDETLYLLETSYYPLFASCPAKLFLGLRFDA